LIFGRKNKVATDNELMLLIASDDQSAFCELYHRYKDRMYYYFFRMLGNSAEQANDFLQELFMKLIEKPESYNSKLPFSTWLYSVANNMCKNEYRRREVRREYQILEAREVPVDFQAECPIETQQLVERIFVVLGDMGEEYRSSFILHYREGFSIKEVSGILGLPEGTIKSRLFYARKILAEKLNYLKDEVEF
jgi:RNA polymerase sigma-70 factor, ECF subfamily